MSGMPLKIQGIVIKKTKLGETDLIYTVQSINGSRFQGIAHGARKPNSSFSSRMELGTFVEMLCSCGKGLPTIKEAKVIESFPLLRSNYELSTRLNAVLDVLNKLIHEDLENIKLFELTIAAIRTLNKEVGSATLIFVAYFLKASSFCGIKPNFQTCTYCNEPIEYQALDCNLWFSICDGGIVCQSCPPGNSSIHLHASYYQWLEALLYTTFDDILSFDISEQELFSLLQFCNEWSKYHFNSKIKSIEFLMDEYSSASCKLQA